MKVKLPSGDVVEVATRDEVAKAIGEREAKMSMLNEDTKKLKVVLRTFAKLEGDADPPADQPAKPDVIPGPVPKTA